MNNTTSSADWLTFTTATTIEELEALAVAIGSTTDTAEKRRKADILQDELSRAHNNIITMAVIATDHLKEYDREAISTKIAEARIFMQSNKGAGEREAAKALRNPIAGLYAHYIEQGRDPWEAEELTKATILFQYANEQRAETVRAETTPPTPQPTAYKIAPELQTEEARGVLAVCEGVICNVKGKGERKAIDTTATPWSYASRSILRCVACNVGRILQMSEPWKAFEDATGVKSLQSASDTQGGEVEQALRKAGYNI